MLILNVLPFCSSWADCCYKAWFTVVGGFQWAWALVHLVLGFLPFPGCLPTGSLRYVLSPTNGGPLKGGSGTFPVDPVPTFCCVLWGCGHTSCLSWLVVRVKGLEGGVFPPLRYTPGASTITTPHIHLPSPYHTHTYTHTLLSCVLLNFTVSDFSPLRHNQSLIVLIKYVRSGC